MARALPAIEDAMACGHILGFLLIGVVAGWLAGVLVKGRGFGLVGDLVVGVLGAALGGFLFSAVGLSAYGLVGSLVMSVVGAVVLLFLIRLIRRGS
jgi:uncharacterized membrane protein YeaQ/YmgE (transglycosylase-associated protein family)